MKWDGYENRRGKIFFAIDLRLENNALHLDAKAEEYTDDLKVKWDGYENRRGKNSFAIGFKGRN